MFFNSSSFKVLEGGAQLTWLNQQVHMQNLANIETPNYKAKRLTFDKVFSQAQGASTPARGIQARIVSDEGTEARLDGNNVNIEVEGLEMYKVQAQYSMILDKIKGQYNQYNAVLNCGIK